MTAQLHDALVLDFPVELLIWLSPAFPIGSFAYSQGLETAVADGLVIDAATLEAWLAALTRHGALGNDLVILSLAYRAATDAERDEIAELAAALQPSAERYFEAVTQGEAFVTAYREAWSRGGRIVLGVGLRPTLAVAVGLAARVSAIDLAATLLAYGAAFHGNLVSAAVRLGIVGQYDSQRVLAALIPELRRRAAGAIAATRDDLGSACFAADLAAMLHETQTTRLFRT
ncbi:MAG: urease accessory protein UreF [Hyphomicrobiales bacterium]|nr:urease accessory protein UreF [Hyphomicrobiales bacterium]